MKRFLVFGTLPLTAGAALFAQAPAPAAAPTPPPVVVVRAARIFDGTGERVLDNAVVVIEGTRIKAVGAGAPLPPGATTVDLGDATLLPGFIDSHMHLTWRVPDNWLRDFYQGLRRTPRRADALAAVYARRCSRPASRRCETSAPTRTKTSGCATRCQGARAGPADARLAVCRSARPAATATRRDFRRTHVRPGPGTGAGHLHGRGPGPAGRPPPDQVRRGRHQDVRLRRRPLAGGRRLRARR